MSAERKAAKAIVATKAEKIVARALADLGVTFEQSALVAEFEVDFLIGRYIAVEVDGAVHVGAEARRHDQYKDRKLASLGFTVLRITNEQARDRSYLQAFLQDIKRLWELEKSVLDSSADATAASLAGHAGLADLRRRLLAAEREKAGSRPTTRTANGDRQREVRSGAVEDEELFRQWVESSPVLNKDGPESEPGDKRPERDYPRRRPRGPGSREGR